MAKFKKQEESKERTSISLLEGFKLKRGFHLALGLALPLIRIHNLATTSVIGVAVVILIDIIVCATPFPIILSIRKTLFLHRRKPIKDRDFPIPASQNPRNCRTPKVQETGTEIRVPQKNELLLFLQFFMPFSLLRSYPNFVMMRNRREQGMKTITTINKGENITAVGNVRIEKIEQGRRIKEAR